MTPWRQFSVRPPQLASKNHSKNQACMYLCTHNLYIRAQNIYFTKVLQMLSEMCIIIIYSYICVSDINYSCKSFSRFSRFWLKHFSWPENLMHNNNPTKTDANGLTISTEAQHQNPHQKNINLLKSTVIFPACVHFCLVKS